MVENRNKIVTASWDSHRKEVRRKAFLFCIGKASTFMLRKILYFVLLCRKLYSTRGEVKFIGKTAYLHNPIGETC